MDASVSPEVIGFTKSIAAAVEGVAGIEKCRIRKSGLQLSMDIHVVVDGDLSVRRSHAIAHQVKDRLLASQHRINDVTVHIEPVSLGDGCVTSKPSTQPPEQDFSSNSPYSPYSPYQK